MALKFYRGVEFVQDYMIKYLNAVFLANEKGQADFYDGVKVVTFSARPHVTKKLSWDFRNIPCVLLSYSSAHLEFLTFEKDYIGQDLDHYTWKESGGQLFTSLSFEIVGSTIEERDKLVDIVSIFISGPSAKDFFGRHDIVIPKGPDISESGPNFDNKIDHPCYVSTVSFEVVSSWRFREDLNDPLLSNVIVDLVAQMDFDE